VILGYAGLLLVSLANVWLHKVNFPFSPNTFET
jgi:hypothetical protein